METMPLVIIQIAYRRPEGHWRAFCVPFDITCEADTLNEATKMLEESIKLYLDGLRKYKFPKHLTSVPLSNKEDEAMIKNVWKKLSEDYQKITSNKCEYKEKGLFGSIKSTNLSLA